MSRLRRGDLLPRMVTAPPGPGARGLLEMLARLEAPGINTLVADGEPTLWLEARGANVLDVDGNRYIDLTAGFGVAAVGHRHPRVVAAVRRQAGLLLHGLADVHAHPARVELARRLARLAPLEDPRVYFGISGADAVEIALKTALLATRRPGIVAFQPAYHGLTLGALAVTARDHFRRPFLEQIHPHVHRLPYGCPAAELGALLGRRGDQIGALILEPMVGREGVIPAPEGWLAEVARLCRHHGVVLIADEIYTGFGRTGPMFAVEDEGVRPDLLCCGKALGGGLPIAATLGRGELMAAWDGAGEALHTATFVAHPLACAAALATLEVIEEERLIARARRLGPRFQARLGPWARRYGGVVAVRGRGFLWGIETSGADLAKRWTRAAMRRGLLVLAGGPDGRVVQVAPPLVTTERQLIWAVEILEAALAEASAQDPGELE